MIDISIDQIINKFIARTTPPILYQFEGRCIVIGSSTLLVVCDRTFLITAAHLFDNIEHRRAFRENFDFSRLRVPVAFFPDNPMLVDLVRLDNAPIYFGATGNDMNRDTAVIDITKCSELERLREGWKHITLESVAAPTRENIPYLLSGHPSEYYVSLGKHAGSQCTVIRTARLPKAPRQTHTDHRVDIMLCYGPKSETRAGKTIDSPKLHGTSGGGVFAQLSDDGKSLWTPEKSIRLIGVQSSAANDGSWFRAKRIAGAIDIIRELGPDLLEEILRHEHLNDDRFQISSRAVAKRTARNRPLSGYTRSASARRKASSG